MATRTLAAPTPRQCFFCQRHFVSKGRRQVCGRQKCEHLRNVINGILRRHREADEAEGKCKQRRCPKPPKSGCAFCEDHEFRKQPCRGCVGARGRVRRNAGQGGQPELCDACRTTAPAARTDGDAGIGA